MTPQGIMGKSMNMVGSRESGPVTYLIYYSRNMLSLVPSTASLFRFTMVYLTPNLEDNQLITLQIYFQFWCKFYYPNYHSLYNMAKVIFQIYNYHEFGNNKFFHSWLKCFQCARNLCWERKVKY